VNPAPTSGHNTLSGVVSLNPFGNGCGPFADADADVDVDVDVDLPFFFFPVLHVTATHPAFAS
jgi:hypothetical protein